MKIFTLYVHILGVLDRSTQAHSPKIVQQFLALMLEKIFASEESDELAVPLNARLRSFRTSGHA